MATQARRSGAGWIRFASAMLMLVGAFNVIDGIAAVSDSHYLADNVMFSNLHAWGWFFVIWGVVQIFAALAILSGQTWGILLGVASAFFNLIAQLSWAHVYPVWALSAMVLDVLVIYGLLVYGWGSVDDV